MAREPQRRDEPRHLDAAIVPVRDALIARAKELEQASHLTRSPDEYPVDVIIARLVDIRMAAEFRKFADELKYW